MIRMSGKKVIIIMSLAALLLCGCGKKEDDQQAQTSDQPANEPAPSAVAKDTTPPAATPPAVTVPDQQDISAKLSETEAKTREALLQMNEGKEIEPVTIETLKGLLPAEVPGMKRTSATSERNEMMGINIAKADGQYEAGGGDSSISIMIMDAGNLSGPMKMGLTGWTMSQHSLETDTGYEKTTMYAGHKAMEEYDNSAKEGALRVFVADRFIVEVEGSGISMDSIKKAMEKIDIKKLAALASN